MNSIKYLNGQATLIDDFWDSQETGIDVTELFDILQKEVAPMLKMTPLYNDEGVYRTQDQKRATAGDQDIIFRYKNLKRTLYPWSPVMKDVRDLVGKECGWISNKCTINQYTPAGLIVPHRDKDYITGFVPDHEFAIFSLGATRDMVFIDTSTNEETFIKVKAGSLLIVTGPLDHTHLHGMRPDLSAQEQSQPVRLSLAFKLHHTVMHNDIINSINN